MSAGVSLLPPLPTSPEKNTMKIKSLSLDRNFFIVSVKSVLDRTGGFPHITARRRALAPTEWERETAARGVDKALSQVIYASLTARLPAKNSGGPRSPQ